jgi:hypothetical protein
LYCRLSAPPCCDGEAGQWSINTARLLPGQSARGRVLGCMHAEVPDCYSVTEVRKLLYRPVQKQDETFAKIDTLK